VTTALVALGGEALAPAAIEGGRATTKEFTQTGLAALA